MNYQVARYVIRAFIIPKGKETFLVSARADPLNEGGPPVDETITCDPCSYEQARTTCYKLVARLAHSIGMQGAVVADVIIIDRDTP
jgi:hypothetical protein